MSSLLSLGRVLAHRIQDQEQGGQGVDGRLIRVPDPQRDDRAGGDGERGETEGSAEGKDEEETEMNNQALPEGGANQD